MRRQLDVDGSGYIELREFGPLLRRLAALARGKPQPPDPDAGFLGAIKAEAALVGTRVKVLTSTLDTATAPWAWALAHCCL